MIRNPKAKGARFEREVKKIFENDGWFVVRQASSAFPDLLAEKKHRKIAIECKTNKNDLKKQELEQLYSLYKNYRRYPYLAYKEKGKIKLKDLIIGGVVELKDDV